MDFLNGISACMLLYGQTGPGHVQDCRSCLASFEKIANYDLEARREIESDYPSKIFEEGPVVVGITAGASCPANLIEATILRVFELRGIKPAEVEAA